MQPRSDEQDDELYRIRLTGQALARVIAARARALGVNMAAERQKVWRWEHSGVTPDRLTQGILADELGVPRCLIDLRPWPGWLTEVQLPSYEQIVGQLTLEIEKGIRALAALGYTPDGPQKARTVSTACEERFRDLNQGELRHCDSRPPSRRR